MPEIGRFGLVERRKQGDPPGLNFKKLPKKKPTPPPPPTHLTPYFLKFGKNEKNIWRNILQYFPM